MSTFCLPFFSRMGMKRYKVEREVGLRVRQRPRNRGGNGGATLALVALFGSSDVMILLIAL